MMLAQRLTCFPAPFKTVVNERLRMALAQSAAVQKRKPFKVKPRAMGGPAAGFSYDNVGAGCAAGGIGFAMSGM